MKWYDKSAFYHIYPLGFCGCTEVNDFKSEPQHNILKVLDAVPHIKECGFNAVYFGPVFESSKHGYDTADYLTIDRRLGTNEDFKRVCDELHKNNIKVVLDGVFNHVGRDFWAFKDVREHGFGSRYKDWFHIRDGGSPYGDPFFYEGWEGHYELVKLNLYNPDVKNYLKDCITKWREMFGIDGLRLDVAYCLEENFLRELHGHCKWISEDFWLMGETLHGDYNRWMAPDKLDSVTNYECYKGLYSSFNDMNMFEIAHSLNRQFGKDQWCLYRGKNLYSFVDNHDVSRIATMLKNKEHLNPIYSLLFTMPGIPSVYYGSEYGIEGDKRHGDASLRLPFELKNDTALTKHIGKLARLRTESNVLACGSYNQLQLMNKQYAFMREFEGKRVVTALNVEGSPFTFNLNLHGSFTNIFTGEKTELDRPLNLPPYSSAVFAEDYVVNEQHSGEVHKETDNIHAEEPVLEVKISEAAKQEVHISEEPVLTDNGEEKPVTAVIKEKEQLTEEQTAAEIHIREEFSVSAENIGEEREKNVTSLLIDVYVNLQRILSSDQPKKEADYQLKIVAAKLKAMGIDTAELEK